MNETNSSFQEIEYKELIAHITNYKSINEVFIDGEISFQKNSDQLQKYINSLEKIIIYGSKDEAEKAQKLCYSIQTAANLLKEISQKLK